MLSHKYESERVIMRKRKTLEKVLTMGEKRGEEEEGNIHIDGNDRFITWWKLVNNNKNDGNNSKQ